MSTCRFDTCFFEQYAQISLAALLGGEFDALENRDRSDLQSADGRSIGIEVTRAMEESRKAEEELLEVVAGITPGISESDVERIMESGYAYGLRGDKVIGVKKLSYWSMALPLRRILESKVAKVGNGFYGHFDQMGLYVFSRENLDLPDAIMAMNYTLSLQKHQDVRYDRLYLADVDDLFVCNLADGLRSSSRLLRYPITQAQRKDFYTEAVRRLGPAD